MSGNTNKKTTPKDVGVTEKKETVKKPTGVNVVNRTNQKQVVAFKGETYEFLANESKFIELSKAKAEERFSVFTSKNILSIIN